MAARLRQALDHFFFFFLGNESLPLLSKRQLILRVDIFGALLFRHVVDQGDVVLFVAIFRVCFLFHCCVFVVGREKSYW